MDAEDAADVSAGRPFLGLVGDRHHVHRLRVFLGFRGGESVADALDGLDRERTRAADDESTLDPGRRIDLAECQDRGAAVRSPRIQAVTMTGILGVSGSLLIIRISSRIRPPGASGFRLTDRL